jgi:hypothetical protein
MRIAVIVAALVSVIAVAAYFVIFADGPDQAALARILGRQGECVKLMSDFRRLGAFKNIVRGGPSEAFVYVDNAQWKQQTTENRLSQSLTVYCALTPPNGYLTVTVRNMEGENVFRIRNGNVAPWF